ncbi:CDP-glycerol:poly(glycerophosphate) glycerophosphotransferase [Bacillus freudenreichii]|nr:CDP-glycerol:poly(glycerophosphate) glycerophosphotransferase [Bacillus freudenreichii]
MDAMIEELKKVIAICLIRVFNCFPIKSNKIFLYSYYGSQYGCNPKYITEYILQNTSKGKFDLVWAFNDISQFEHLTEIRKVKTMSLRYFYELCTSKVIITNFRTTDLFIKRKNQYYIQTWHSSLRLKQIEKDAEASLPKKYVEMAKKDSEKCDLLISGCEYSTKIFRRAFWYDGEILESGTPSHDILFSSKKVKYQIYKKLEIPKKYKTILYAPTFRKNMDLSVYDLDYSALCGVLSEKLGGEWMVLIRLHPHLTNLANQMNSNKNTKNVTAYSDVQELIACSDLLVTDYSSVMFSYLLTKKPCFLYVPDLEEYLSYDRKLYFNIADLPFKSAKTNQELCDNIRDFNNENYLLDVERLTAQIRSFETGKASEVLVKKINKLTG